MADDYEGPNRRRAGPWTNPATWFGLAGLLISLAGVFLSFVTAFCILVGIYVSQSVQTAKIEVVNANLINKTTELGGQINDVNKSVQAAREAQITVTKDQQNQGTAIQDLKAFRDTQVVYNGTFDKKTVEIESRLSALEKENK